MSVRRKTKGMARKRPAARPAQWWHNIKSTGNYDADEELGVACGHRALQQIRQDNFAPLLGWIVIDMIKTKSSDAFVIGFCGVFGDMAARGAK